MQMVVVEMMSLMTVMEKIQSVVVVVVFHSTVVSDARMTSEVVKRLLIVPVGILMLVV